jgi:hypothetical protein
MSAAMTWFLRSHFLGSVREGNHPLKIEILQRLFKHGRELLAGYHSDSPVGMEAGLLTRIAAVDSYGSGAFPVF